MSAERLGRSQAILLSLLFIGIGSSVAVALVKATNEALLLAFLAFFCFSFLDILRKDIVFSVFYALLFLYSFFGQVAYAVFPTRLSAYTINQYYGQDWFMSIWGYAVLTFALVYLMFRTTLRFRHRSRAESLEGHVTNTCTRRDGRQILFYAAVLGHLLVLLFYLQQTYSALSYQSQSLLKSNMVFLYAYAMSPAVILALVAKYTLMQGVGLARAFAGALVLSSVSTYLMLATRAGQRGEIVTLFVGIFMYIVPRLPIRKQRTTLPISIVAGYAVLSFVNAIRYARRDLTSLSGIISLLLASPREYVFRLDLEAMTFQDYVNPALTLGSSMFHNLVIPWEVIKSNLVNLLVVVDYPTLGEKVSRLIDPFGSAGYGFSILTEGYMFCGWWGTVYTALVFVIGYSLWRRFTRTSCREFNAFMIGVVCSNALSVIRGQSFFFLKSIYTIFIPAACLFLLAMPEHSPFVHRVNRRGPGGSSHSNGPVETLTP